MEASGSATVLWLVQGPLGRLTDLVLAPFRGLPTWVGLAAVALGTSVVILLVFRATSDQRALRRVKSRIVAGILEIRLFRDDPRLVWRAQADILRQSLRYFRLSLVPLAWVIVPVLLLMAQLQVRYGYGAPGPDERTIVRVQLAETVGPTGTGEQLDLQVPDGVRVETPLLYLVNRHQALWGVSAPEPGRYDLRVQRGDWSVEKALTTLRGVEPRSPRRPSRSAFDQLLYPGEPPVPSGSPVRWVEIDYPEASVELLGWRTHWMVWFFILTILFAYALQRPLGVTI